MIYDNNSTSLGMINVPMAEGYDGNIGVADALIESARNDLNMFKRLVSVDVNEIRINNESAGVVNESELMALKEASVSGILEKIKELFKKLIAKIKAIFHTFISKLNGLWMKDKDLVKKYQTEIQRKTNIGNLEVKWRKHGKQDAIFDASVYLDINTAIDNVDKYWDSDPSTRFEKFSNGISEGDIREEVIDNTFEDEETLEIKEIPGGARGICNFLTNYSKKLKEFDRANKEKTKDIERAIKKLDSKYKDYKFTNVKSSEDGAKQDEEVKSLNKQYDCATTYQSVVLKVIAAESECVKIEYKQHKAAFMKMVAANDKKLEESAIYAEAIAEAAANEVEDVIDSALSKEQISKICNASKNVLDGEVSDDPSKLTYGEDCYTTNGSYVPTAGTKDSDIQGTKESFVFDDLQYV